MKKLLVVLGLVALSASFAIAQIAACGQGNTAATNVATGQTVWCCDLGEGLLSCTDGNRWFHAHLVE